jgi:hypothetical protein
MFGCMGCWQAGNSRPNCVAAAAFSANPISTTIVSETDDADRDAATKQRTVRDLYPMPLRMT